VGYTHYWRQTRNLTRDEWAAMTADFTELFNYAQHMAGIPLADGMGEAGTQPIIGKSNIAFNGVGDDHHETFFIRRVRDPEDYEFCKTAQKPYDAVVTACLCYLSTCLDTPAFRVSSDGSGPDFLDGLDLARKALPRKANILDIPMEIMAEDRWTAPWISCQDEKGIQVRFCVNGKGYVFKPKGESYCFPTHLALAEFLEKHKEAHFQRGGNLRMGNHNLSYGPVEPNIWDATGSFDETRHKRIAAAQQRVLATLFPVPRQNAEQPPAYVRPMEYLRPEDNGTFCYSLKDILERFGTHAGVAA
jgi:hypothetical protein